ncbi:MAG: DPP IV N-terminal domain-containing protein [Acidobacteria bacterium]|nr:DPP IV N-terminal domain-containing protein [Acidobacteriota bacterium]
MTLTILLSFGLCWVPAQGTLADYQRAETFLRPNVEKLIFNTQVAPHWIGEEPRFWFVNQTRSGKKYMLCDIPGNTLEPAFDHPRMAAVLSKFLTKTLPAEDLPIRQLEFPTEQREIHVRLKDKWIAVRLDDYQCRDITTERAAEQAPGKSPDGKWLAFVGDYDLYVRPVAGGDAIRLTWDGTVDYAYALAQQWDELVCVSDSSQNKGEPEVAVSWSPDSRRLLTHRRDSRRARDLFLFQSTPDQGFRARVWSYERALPGETDTSLLQFMIFDVETRARILIDLPPLSPVTAWGMPRWFEDGRRLHYHYHERGYQTLHLVEIDATTGHSRTVLTETSPTVVDVGLLTQEITGDGDELFWASERDGWNQLYLFDWKTGQLKNHVTRGAYVVREIIHVDEKERQVFFTANGREPDRDPYLRHLYRAGFDGNGLVLLTPENAEHEITISPDKKYVIDTYSRVDLPPVTVIRALPDGGIIRTIAAADITDLQATGWQPPEPFTVKGPDGKTDIYGVIIKPTTFDPNRSYPVIDAAYSGPHTIRTPKSYRRGCLNEDLAMAELGFVVVTVDGFGTAYRSKKFHDFSYRNLGDIGAADHIAALQQLAKKHNWMDISRVGMYGHSAGGYDTVRALLTHPEFYKVGVASAGNHDHRMAKAWWPEHWMGMPGGHYDEQSNLTHAADLQGKLLLMHGDMDANVNPACTLRLNGALIAANKDFDLVIIPNRGHNLGDHPYVVRRRWDYFVQHLLGVTPPREYTITAFRKKND